jgi:hypothetical protein
MGPDPAPDRDRGHLVAEAGAAGAGQGVGRLEGVEHRGQAGVEHVVDAENGDPHWRE